MLDGEWGRVRVGERLRQVRLARSLSIEETAWRTRLRPDLIRALEDEDFAWIGHRAFVRRHLATYARFLGVDQRGILAEFEAGHAAPEPSAIEELERRRRVSRKPPKAKWLVAGVLSAAVLAGAASLGVLGGQAEPKPAVPSGPRVEEGASRSGERALPVPAAEARVRLRVLADATTAVSVFVDGAQVFDGTLHAGGSKLFRAREGLEIVVGDAAAVRLRVNGRDLGRPGSAGEAWRGRFGPQGAVTG